MDSQQEPLINSSGDYVPDLDAGSEVDHNGKASLKQSPGLFIWLLTLSAGISGLLFGYTVPVMVVGRSIVGAAVGAASFVVPLYIAELAPAAFRGRLVTVNILFVTLGQVVAYIVGWIFAEHGSRGTGWRWMVGLGALPAVLQTVLVVSMPETPRWLVKAGRRDTAREVIRKVTGTVKDAAKTVEMTLKNIEIEVREEEEARRVSGRRHHTGGLLSWVGPLEELFAVRRNRRALAIACLLQGLQQLCGFNSLMYFSSTIFTMLGFSIPTLTSLVVAITNLIFTIAALLSVDRIGRRRILLYSIPFMIIGLLLSAYGFSFVKLSTDDTTTTVAKPSAQHAALLILFSIMIYVAAYAIGLGNVPWMQSELFSLSVRSTGSGLATATNWGANFIVGLTFLPLMDALTPSWTFTLYAIVCAVGLSLVWKYHPETSGLSLEEAASLLEDDSWGVRTR
ncbi:hypothetical protein DL546_004508 [Coniochaeta pulveracea]|uniref:Major facilitator superfamily (MFS) profile domain-containing protein n=1 Tax=Coniochaeta pulveracea TaxID=177199 RepID=A0A420YHH5_9PEZI|nr:hypothetical protein DL546_004508 [Coniochaeta pulveracea]